METYEEFKEFVNRPGAKATIMEYSWLKKGCPFCGCKKWEVTSDCYAYCCKCSRGFSTIYPFTNMGELVSVLDFTEESAP
jgi:hypothetical protein